MVNIYAGGEDTIAGKIDQGHLNEINFGVGQGVVTALQSLLNLQYYGTNSQAYLGLTADNTGAADFTTQAFKGSVVDIGGASNSLLPEFVSLSLVNQSIIGPMYSCPIANTPTHNFTGSANGNSPIPALANVPYLYAFCFENGNDRSVILIKTDVSGPNPISFPGRNPPQGSVAVRQ